MTAKIVERVYVKSSSTSVFLPPDPEDPPHEMHGSYYRNGRRGRWMRRVVAEIEVDGKTPVEVAAVIFTAGEGLTNPKVSLDHDYDGAAYGDGCLYSLNVVGDRLATDDEVRWIKWQIAYDEQREREWQDRQVEQLKAARPELFKEGE